VTFLSYNIQFVYEDLQNKKKTKTKQIFCMLSMLPLHHAVVPVFKSLFSTHSPAALLRNSLNKFFFAP